MGTDNHQTAPTGSQQVSLSDAEPYRSPAEVSRSSQHRLMRSPWAWVLVAGVLGGLLVMFASARTVSDQGVTDYVDDFGGTRSGASMERPDEYER